MPFEFGVATRELQRDGQFVSLARPLSSIAMRLRTALSH